MLENHYEEITSAIRDRLKGDPSINPEAGQCSKTSGDPLKVWNGRPFERCCQDTRFEDKVFLRVSMPAQPLQTVLHDELRDQMIELRRPVTHAQAYQIDIGAFCTSRGKNGHTVLFTASFSPLAPQITGRLLNAPERGIFLPPRHTSKVDERMVSRLLQQPGTLISFQEFMRHLIGDRQQFQQLRRVENCGG